MRLALSVDGIAVRVSMAAVAACLGLAGFCATACADITFGPQGSGAGQLDVPSGIAADEESGEVYVAEAGNDRVSVFDEDGVFLRAFGFGVNTGAEVLEVCTAASGCQAGIEGSAGGQFHNPQGIDVDDGGVFVYTTDDRIQRFSVDVEPVAFERAFGDGVNVTTGGNVCTAASGDSCGAGVRGFEPGEFNFGVKIAGGDGIVYVADLSSTEYRVQAFGINGALSGQPLTKARVGNFLFIAADSTGNFYLGNPGDISKFDPTGVCVAFCITPLEGGAGIAVDNASGEIFAGMESGFLVGGRGLMGIARYSPGGALLSVLFGDEPIKYSDPQDLAARVTAEGDVYLVRQNFTSGQISHIPAPVGPVASLRPLTTDPIGNTAATVGALVNPEGEATTYHLEYITAADYAANGDSFTGPNPATSTAETAVGADFTTHEVKNELTGLVPETTYRVRAVATNPSGTDTGPEGTFTTREPF